MDGTTFHETVGRMELEEDAGFAEVGGVGGRGELEDAELEELREKPEPENNSGSAQAGRAGRTVYGMQAIMDGTAFHETVGRTELEEDAGFAEVGRVGGR